MNTTNIKFTKLTEAETNTLVLEFEIDKELFLAYKNITIEKLGKDIELPGFRKGNAPASAVEVKLGNALYEEVLNEIIPVITTERLNEIITEYKILGRAEYEIKKFVPTSEDGYPLIYKAKFSLFPHVVLPKKEALSSITKDSDTVTEEEINVALQDVKKDLSEGKLDEPYKSMSEEELLSFINTGLSNEKKTQVEQKYKGELLHDYVSKCELKISEKIIDDETNARVEDYKTRVKELGVNFEEFLNMQSKKLEDFIQDTRNKSEESLRTTFVLSEVIALEKLNVNQDEVLSEIEKLSETEKLKYQSAESKNQIGLILLQQKAVNWILTQYI